MTPTFPAFQQVHDPLLGRLEFDSALNWWDGAVDLEGEEVGLLIWSQEQQMRLDGEALAFLRGFFKVIRSELNSIRLASAAVVIERLRHWPAYSDSRLTLKTLALEMTVERLELSLEGQAAVYFCVGDLLPRPFIGAITDEHGELRAVDLKG